MPQARHVHRYAREKVRKIGAGFGSVWDLSDYPSAAREVISRYQRAARGVRIGARLLSRAISIRPGERLAIGG
jgi:hypothetical protein